MTFLNKSLGNFDRFSSKIEKEFRLRSEIQSNLVIPILLKSFQFKQDQLNLIKCKTFPYFFFLIL